MAEPFSIDADQLDEEFFQAEELRRQIRLAIEKMDYGQLVIMSSLAMVSEDEKNKEHNAMLNPKKRRKKLSP